jgi:hypothetical protein
MGKEVKEAQDEIFLLERMWGCLHLRWRDTLE